MGGLLFSDLSKNGTLIGATVRVIPFDFYIRNFLWYKAETSTFSFISMMWYNFCTKHWSNLGGSLVPKIKIKMETRLIHIYLYCGDNFIMLSHPWNPPKFPKYSIWILSQVNNDNAWPSKELVTSTRWIYPSSMETIKNKTIHSFIDSIDCCSESGFITLLCRFLVFHIISCITCFLNITSPIFE